MKAQGGKAGKNEAGRLLSSYPRSLLPSFPRSLISLQPRFPAIRKHIHHLAAGDPLLNALPELDVHQVPVLGKEVVAQGPCGYQEGLELFRKHVLVSHMKPGFCRKLLLD